jgi:hypothetical protein
MSPVSNNFSYKPALFKRTFPLPPCKSTMISNHQIISRKEIVHL